MYVVYKFKNNNTTEQNCFIYVGQHENAENSQIRRLHRECCNRKRFEFVAISLCITLSCTVSQHTQHDVPL